MSKPGNLPAADRRRLYPLWTMLVLVNASVSFVIALGEYRHPLDRLAMGAGIATFIVVYAEAACFALDRGRPDWHRALIISASLKALTQFAPVVEVVTGVLAIQLVEAVYGEVVFWGVYLTTLVDGALLSVLVLLLAWPVRFAGSVWAAARRRQQADAQFKWPNVFLMPPKPCLNIPASAVLAMMRKRVSGWFQQPPYLLVYRVRADAIELLRVWHLSRHRPGAE